MSNIQQKIGLWPLTSLVTGNLVGSGVFMLPVTLAAFGSISILGWIATSIGAILLALIFASLAAHASKTGGPYVYIREAFGDSLGFYSGFGYWMLSWISNSALAIGAVGYITVIIGDLGTGTSLMLELLIIVIVASYNLLGIKTTGYGELIITTCKVLPLIMLPLIGLFFMNSDNFPPINTSGKDFFITLNTVAFITLWGFIGLETATVPGGQVLYPKRTIPLATIIGTLIAALIYILGTVVIMGVIPFSQLTISKAPYADCASIIFGGSWGIPIASLAVISCVGTLNGWTMVVGRIAQGLSQDGLFPKFFSKTNRFGTPYIGVILSSCLSIPFIFFSLQDSLIEQFNAVIDISVTLVLVIYGLCICSYFKIFYTIGALTVQRIILGVFAGIFIIWALWAASLKSILLSFGFLLLAIPFRFFVSRKV